MDYRLRLTERQYQELKQHLLPADGKEAVALLLCGRRVGNKRHILVGRQVIPVPYSECKARRKNRVTWSTSVIDSIMAEAARNHLAIVKLHSHRETMTGFSSLDDNSDQSIYQSISSLLGDSMPHASVVLFPDGKMIGRVMEDGVITAQLSSIMVVGNDISVFGSNLNQVTSDEFAIRHTQVFGERTYTMLRRMSVAIIGCSGTGSIVAEQLARLGVGRIVLVDPDVVEEKNLNRILNSSKEDAYLHRPKVRVIASAIASMGLGQEVEVLQSDLDSAEVVKSVAECDVVFGCMDSTYGRQLLNRLSTFYVLPYFDVGVGLQADGVGGIDTISGAVHYLQPGLSTLMEREVYTAESVRAEELRKSSPALYEAQRKQGYIRGVDEDRPAVISVNMLLASLMVNDFLARIHPYRNCPNQKYATIRVNLTEVAFLLETEINSSGNLAHRVGWGDIEPLLERPSLSC